MEFVLRFGEVHSISTGWAGDLDDRVKVWRWDWKRRERGVKGYLKYRGGCEGWEEKDQVWEIYKPGLDK